MHFFFVLTLLSVATQVLGLFRSERSSGNSKHWRVAWIPVIRTRFPSYLHRPCTDSPRSTAKSIPLSTAIISAVRLGGDDRGWALTSKEVTDGNNRPLPGLSHAYVVRGMLVFQYEGGSKVKLESGMRKADKSETSLHDAPLRRLQHFFLQPSPPSTTDKEKAWAGRGRQCFWGRQYPFISDLLN